MCVNPSNNMGTMPVRRLVLHMSWPMMLSMLVQALYNMVDSYFVAKISQDAFEALGFVTAPHRKNFLEVRYEAD